MRLKLYRAGRMAEAMSRIRAELGPDALILSTRRIATGVEVTAALEEPEAEPVACPPVGAEPEHGFAGKLNHHGIPQDLARRLVEYQELRTGLTAHLKFAALPEDVPLLLVGPPGAGKTLTTARLATRYVLAGVTPTVITADGKRAGAAEQLAAYTRLLSLRLLVAQDAVILAKALAQPRPAGPVLIDTAGSDPFRQSDQTEIQALAATARAIIVLVLPAGLCPDEAAELAAAYGQAGASHLIATRLDLARRLGGVIAAAQAGRLALAEAGIGSNAADGLTPLTPDYLTARLLGKETTL